MYSSTEEFAAVEKAPKDAPNTLSKESRRSGSKFRTKGVERSSSRDSRGKKKEKREKRERAGSKDKAEIVESNTFLV